MTMLNFKKLPNFSRYNIYENGDVFDIKMNRNIGYYNNSGYLFWSFTDDQGRRSWDSLHRFVALAFVSNNNPECFNIVNHLNGIKDDNRSSNLEWTSAKGNLVHAHLNGLNARYRPFEVRNVETKEVKYYSYALDHAKELGLDKDSIRQRLQKGPSKIWPGNLQYRYKVLVGPMQEWEEPTDVKYGVVEKIKIKNMLSNEVIIVESMTKAASYLKLSMGRLSKALNSENDSLLKKKYLIKKFDDNSNWPVIKDLMLLDKNVTPVVLMDSNGNKKTYNSAVECAKDLGILKSTLNYRLSTNGSIFFKDGFSYKRYHSPLIE